VQFYLLHHQYEVNEEHEVYEEDQEEAEVEVLEVEVQTPTAAKYHSYQEM
jgi:hypothetical protein